MKKLDVLNFAFCSLYVVSAFLLSTLVASLLMNILNRIVYIDFFISAILSFAISFTVSVGIVFIFIFRECYHENYFAPLTTAVEMSVGLAVNFLVGIIFKFPPILSGGVRNFAGIIGLGTNLDSVEMLKEIPLTAKMLAFLIYAIIFMGVAFIAGSLGNKKRNADKASLFNAEKNEKSFK